MTGPERARELLREQVANLESDQRRLTQNAQFHREEAARYQAAADANAGASLVLNGLLAQLDPPDGLGK